MLRCILQDNAWQVLGYRLRDTALCTELVSLPIISFEWVRTQSQSQRHRPFRNTSDKARTSAALTACKTTCPITRVVRKVQLRWKPNPEWHVVKFSLCKGGGTQRMPQPCLVSASSAVCSEDARITECMRLMAAGRDSAAMQAASGWLDLGGRSRNPG